MKITIEGNSSENKKAIEILQEISKYSDIKINIDIKDKEFIMENGSDRIFYEILDIKNINGTNKYHCIEIFSKAESNINFDQSIHRIITKDELVKELEDIKTDLAKTDQAKKGYLQRSHIVKIKCINKVFATYEMANTFSLKLEFDVLIKFDESRPGYGIYYGYRI